MEKGPLARRERVIVCGLRWPLELGGIRVPQAQLRWPEYRSLGAVSLMSTGDGRVIGMEPVVTHGAPEFLLNIVVVAEGYQEPDLPEFAHNANRFADRLLATAPFDEARCGINIWRGDVASTDRGADDPAECGGLGRTPATYFDASFCAFGIPRGMSVNEGAVIDVVKGFIPQWHCIIVLANSPIYGGTGGQVAKSSVASGWQDIMIHEMGHSLFGLADEYESLLGCGQDTDRNEWPSFLGIRFEAAEPNITIETNRGGLKWRDLVDSSTPIPTTTNADCTLCDPQPSPVPSGTVGTFEGAGTYHCKVYRPEFSCKIRHHRNPFCAVCRRRIKSTIDAYHLIAISLLPEFRLRHINDYAKTEAFVGGFPNFYQTDYGQGLVFGSILLHAGPSEWREVSATDLGVTSAFEERFRAVL